MKKVGSLPGFIGRSVFCCRAVPGLCRRLKSCDALIMINSPYTVLTRTTARNLAWQNMARQENHISLPEIPTLTHPCKTSHEKNIDFL